MKRIAMLAALGLAVAAGPAFAAGDAAKGEKLFARCKACHMIDSGDEMIQRGGQTGPNLYGVIGRQAGSLEGFRYGDSIAAAGEKGLTWDQESLAEYVSDPTAFLSEYLGERARSRMSFKLRRGGEDVAAYLASVAE